MFCAACSEETSGSPCASCGGEPLLDGRYRLEHPLGRGASGITWAATRLEDGELVAIKAVPLPPGLGDKERELVAREVQVLRQVDHRGIPALLDALQVRGGAGVRVQYLVQEFVPGRTLHEELDEHRFSEDEVLALLEEILPVLAYLHGLSPPVVHRDIKPRNLMRRPDGSLVLIDFGAVKDALSHPDFGGSTVAGTFGFMAPEQFRGDAEPRSDLYALGVTAIALLSRVAPRTLLDVDGSLAWRPHVRVSPKMGALLEALVARDPAERPSSADEVLAWIRTLRDEGTQEAPIPPRTEAPRGAPVAPRAMVAAALALMGVALFAVLATLDGGTPPKSVVVEPKGAPVEAFQLRGLRLGQTVDEARAAFPELADGERIDGERVHARVGALDIEGLMEAVAVAQEVPGPAWRVRTLLADILADCALHFSVSQTLSRLSCQVDEEVAAGAFEPLLAALGERHGRRAAPPEDPFTGARTARWEDASGTITLHAEDRIPFHDGGHEVSLEVVSAAHARVVDEAVERAEAALREARAAQRAEAEAEQQREIEALKQRIGDGDGGL